jgi:ADP-ribose pyrophosphatase
MRTVPEDAILMPDTAKKVFTGKIFDVYQWPQTLFDGTTATFEMLRRPDTILFLCIKDDKLVLVDEMQPGRPRFVRVPGGRVDPGEDWLSTAQRECSEELGMTFKEWRLVSVRQPVAKIEWFVAVYIASDFVEQYAPHIDAGEQITIVEQTWEQLQQRLLDDDSPLSVDLQNLFQGLNGLDELRTIPEFQGKQIGN